MRFWALLFIIVSLVANSFVMSYAQTRAHNKMSSVYSVKNSQVKNQKKHDCCKQCHCTSQSDCQGLHFQSATVIDNGILFTSMVRNQVIRSNSYHVIYSKDFLERIDRPPIS